MLAKVKHLAVLILISLLLKVSFFSEQLPKALAKSFKFPAKIRNLDFPTDLTFASNGDLYFTEKNGALRVVKKGKQKPRTLIKIKVPKLSGYNETGLLGIALSPDFLKNNFIYLYHTYKKKDRLFNRVIRINAKNFRKKPVAIIDNIIGGRIHNGGKLKFGPDGKLYIATGEADRQSLAQDKNSLNGKVLRIDPDKEIPVENPFANAVWSYGHRNIFGMVFDQQGNLYVTENGPVGDDEINKIRKGSNYGWPFETGKGSGNFEQPLIVYKDSIAPTGIIFYTGNKFLQLKNRLIFGDWNNGDIHLLTIKEDQATDDLILRVSSITAIAQSPDGDIYFATQKSIFRLPPDKIK